MDGWTIELGGEEYQVRREGDVLRLGRRVGGETAWLDDVPMELLPAPAREALERGDHPDPALQTALLGIVDAQVQRGG
jgi:hypothetical protein